MDLLTVLFAVCFIESSGHHTVLNVRDGHSASYGSCQIKYSTAKHMGYKGSIISLWLDRSVNTEWAGKYLNYQYAKYGNWKLAVAAYNAGRVKYNQKGELVNKKYVEKVFSYLSNGDRVWSREQWCKWDTRSCRSNRLAGNYGSNRCIRKLRCN